KCLGKMGEVTKEGRTVLFVSHNMAAIEHLTNRCVLLQDGRILFYDSTRKVINRYLENESVQQNVDIRSWKIRSGVGGAKITKFVTLSIDNKSKKVFRPREPIRLLIGVEFEKPCVADIAVVVETVMERPLFASHLSDYMEPREWPNYQEFIITILPNYLMRGRYLVTLVAFYNKHLFYDMVYHFPAFDIEGSPILGQFPIERWGDFFFPLEWEVVGHKQQ
ncbi:MAG: Wzt carbohydrate-binding domain-containing protein, partial [Candidatus Omnitrophica bacterium]|nr:Wzt carbohydrate-binding domain-containing protein [Candidatus Omnitrophota bacterium]